jgi:arsenite-transporting ATPase
MGSSARQPYSASTASEPTPATRTRVELFIGKGGVGKSTLACAAAFACAKSGGRVLLVSIDQAHSLGDVLDTHIAHDAGAVTGIQTVGDADSVEVIEIDSLALLEDRFRDLMSSAARGAGRGHGHPLTALDPAELTGLPGAQELLALNEIREYVDEQTWDTVIVDCGPSADLLRTVAAPDMLLGYLDRLWPPGDRMAAVLGTDPRAAVLAATVDRVVAGVTAVRALLAHRRTSAVLVTSAERVAAAEAARTRSAATVLGLRLAAVVVNKVLPQLESESAARPDPMARWYRDRRAEQSAVLADLRVRLADVRTVVVPHTDGEPIGPRALTALGGTLRAALADAASGSVPAASAAVRLESGEGVAAVYALAIPVRLVDPATLRLGRAGDDLILGADGVRRRVRLASVLRRCVVAGAELDGSELIVRFRPDPEVWPA